MKNTYILDGTRLLERQSAFELLKEILALPDYFSNNLDSLYDCLTEFFQGSNFIIINAEEMRADSFSNKLLNVIEKAGQQGGYHLMILD
ncbi:MAG: barstar family protein [Erysipelotrichaceae bacterium]